MRNFQRSIFDSRDFISAEKHTDEVRGWTSQVNGGLGQENLPYRSIETANLDVGVSWDGLFDTSRNGVLKQGVGQVQSTQSYFSVQSDAATTWNRPAWKIGDNLTKTGTSVMLLQPVASYPSTDYSWQGVINPLIDKISKGPFMRIPTKEGMLHIEGMVDIEFLFQSRVNQQGQPPFPITIYGANWRFNIYLFVNNKMVATTGKLSAGHRQAFLLSASVPIDSRENTEIDLRFSAELSKTVASPTLIQDPFSIHIFNTQLWCRNHFR
jgi:hypothetical protein